MILEAGDLIDWIADHHRLLVAAWAPELHVNLLWERPYAEAFADELHSLMVTTMLGKGTGVDFLKMVARSNTGLERAREEAVAERFYNVTALDRRMKDDPSSYHLLKMNGAAFRFDGNARIIPDPNYSRIGWGANELTPLLADMRDFANRSRFRAFYDQHLPLYQAQAADINTGFGADRMVKWLAAQFPATPNYDSIRIIFSPLVGSNQSSAKLDDRGFRELQAHINYPDAKQDDLKISARGLAVQRGAILFTELNHGFIDEPSAKHLASIAAALKPPEAWVEAGPTGDAYGDPKSLFDEMMNWALISLYATDNAAPQDVESIMAWTENIMQRYRGFIRFRPFNRRLVQLYRERPDGATVASLYEALVASMPAIANEPAYGVRLENGRNRTLRFPHLCGS